MKRRPSRPGPLPVNAPRGRSCSLRDPSAGPPVRRSTGRPVDRSVRRASFHAPSGHQMVSQSWPLVWWPGLLYPTEAWRKNENETRRPHFNSSLSQTMVRARYPGNSTRERGNIGRLRRTGGDGEGMAVRGGVVDRRAQSVAPLGVSRLQCILLGILCRLEPQRSRPTANVAVLPPEKNTRICGRRRPPSSLPVYPVSPRRT